MVITVTRRHLVWALIVLALIVPRVAFSTGTLTIPNTIAAQSGPTLAASLLDTNWTNTATYINAREVTFAALAARPAAGVSGRYYFATDDNSGTLYGDTGAAWTALAPAVGSGFGAYQVRGLTAATATATNSQANTTASVVTLRNPTTGATYSTTATVTATNNIFTSGPAANGRDRAAVLSPSSWAHLYYIWNGSSIATLSSPCAPTDVTSCASAGGPILPTGYTFWAYIAAVRINASGTITGFHALGSWVKVDAALFAVSGGGATTTTLVTLSGIIPPNALNYQINGYATYAATGAGAAAPQLNFELAAGTGTTLIFSGNVAASQQGAFSVSGILPSVTTGGVQGVNYFWSNLTNAASLSANFTVTSYQVPNGGE